MDAKEAAKATTRIVQDMVYKLSDLCARYPEGAAVFFLAAEQLHIRAVLPLRLTVKWCFPETKVHPAGTWKTTRPDTDNLQKILKDEMTRLSFWKDDAQVCSEIIEKFWWQIPGIFIEVEELDGDGDL